MAAVAERVCIRRAQVDDLPALMPCIATFVQTAPLGLPYDLGWIRAALESYCTGTSSGVWLAETDGLVVGVLVAHCIPYLLHPGVSIVQEQALYVLEPYRAQGIAAHFLATLEAWAQSLHAAAVILSGFAGWSSVEPLYQAQGYQLFEHHFLKAL